MQEWFQCGAKVCRKLSRLTLSLIWIHIDLLPWISSQLGHLTPKLDSKWISPIATKVLAAKSGDREDVGILIINSNVVLNMMHKKVVNYVPNFWRSPFTWCCKLSADFLLADDFWGFDVPNFCSLKTFKPWVKYGFGALKVSFSETSEWLFFLVYRGILIIGPIFNNHHITSISLIPCFS